MQNVQIFVDNINLLIISEEQNCSSISITCINVKKKFAFVHYYYKPTDNIFFKKIVTYAYESMYNMHSNVTDVNTVINV